jgi:hypothetical protein
MAYLPARRLHEFEPGGAQFRVALADLYVGDPLLPEAVQPSVKIRALVVVADCARFQMKPRAGLDQPPA